MLCFLSQESLLETQTKGTEKKQRERETLVRVPNVRCVVFVCGVMCRVLGRVVCVVFVVWCVLGVVRGSPRVEREMWLTLASILLGHILTLLCVRGSQRAREREREKEVKERTSVCSCISPCKRRGSRATDGFLSTSITRINDTNREERERGVLCLWVVCSGCGSCRVVCVVRVWWWVLRESRERERERERV